MERHKCPPHKYVQDWIRNSSIEDAELVTFCRECGVKEQSYVDGKFLADFKRLSQAELEKPDPI